MHSAIIAHRGGATVPHRENTLSAFLSAIQLGADYVEFDIRQTSDHQLVVFHNDSINGQRLSSLTYSKLRSIAAQYGCEVPLLTDVLRLCKGKIKLDIELKETGYEESVVSLVKNDYAYDEFMIKSFNDISVSRVKHIDPCVKTGLLIGRNKYFPFILKDFFPVSRLKKCGADFVSPRYVLATHGFIARMHFHKIGIFVWTPNTTKYISKYLKRRVDGIITDYPGIALSLRERKE